jgi:hypothetical protein
LVERKIKYPVAVASLSCQLTCTVAGAVFAAATRVGAITLADSRVRPSRASKWQAFRSVGFMIDRLLDGNELAFFLHAALFWLVRFRISKSLQQ